MTKLEQIGLRMWLIFKDFSKRSKFRSLLKKMRLSEKRDLFFKRSKGGKFAVECVSDGIIS